MAQEVVIAGALFQDVPSVKLRDSNNVYHDFVDTSDANATANDILEGYTRYVNGSKVTGTATGGAGSLKDVVTQLQGGGDLHTITAIDLSQDTVDARHLATGYTAHDASGTAIVGTMSGGGSANIQPLSVTQNGTYTRSGGVDGYSPVTVNVSGGGGTWSWMGKNPTLEKTVDEGVIYFKDTNYATWTPTTTATTMIQSHSIPYGVDTLEGKDWIIVMKSHTHYEYGAGAVEYAKPYDTYQSQIGVLGWYWSNLTNFRNENYNTLGFTALLSNSNVTIYLNGSGTEAINSSTQYGLYRNTFSLGSTGISTGNIGARTYSSTFNETNANAIDQSASYIHTKYEIWSVDRGTAPYTVAKEIVYDLYDNGM